MCVTGGGLEASSGASQASGGCKQADSRNHTSSGPGAGLNPRQGTPAAASQKALSGPSGAGGDPGGQGSVQTSCSQIVHSGSISTVSTGDSATGL